MLEGLKQLFERRGFLSGLIIDETDDLPASSSYRSRFGSLLRAYQLIGYTPERDYEYVEINRVLRCIHSDVVTEVVAQIKSMGGAVARAPQTDLLMLNDESTTSISIARCHHTAAAALL